MRLGVEAAFVGGELVPGDVEISDGRVARYGLASPRGRGTAAPGFIDLQVNGFGGVDFMSADAAGYARAGAALLETGVTAYQPTLISAPEEALVSALQTVPRGGAGGPRILGVHLEGPFISARRLGVHPPAARRDPDLALALRLLEAGPVSSVTLAPELPDASDLVRLLRGRGVTVSFGHSDADADEAHRAFDEGVATVTHLLNAMRPLDRREPGIAGVALAREDVVVQIIADGVHLAPDIVRVIWRAAAGRVAVVTDAVAAAGRGDGTFELAGIEVEVRGGVARRVPDGVLAGGVGTMIDAVRNLHAWGVPLGSALQAASAVPARILGLTGIGVIEENAAADLVVLDDSLGITRVILGGAQVA
jgi:N-acetylglucosamine-6-phosphate deacetylase